MGASQVIETATDDSAYLSSGWERLQFPSFHNFGPYYSLYIIYFILIFFFLFFLTIRSEFIFVAQVYSVGRTWEFKLNSESRKKSNARTLLLDYVTRNLYQMQ
jgi:hypothetical protein